MEEISYNQKAYNKLFKSIFLSGIFGISIAILFLFLLLKITILFGLILFITIGLLLNLLYVKFMIKKYVTNVIINQDSIELKLITDKIIINKNNIKEFLHFKNVLAIKFNDQNNSKEKLCYI